MKHRKSRHDVSLEKSRSPDQLNITACSPDGKLKTEVIHDSDISAIIGTLRNEQYLKFVTMCMDHVEIRKLIMLRFGVEFRTEVLSIK